MLLQSHAEIQIVTPRTLKAFAGPVLVLPDVRCVSREEARLLKSYSKSGKGLVVTAETGAYDENREKQSVNPVFALLGMGDARGGAKRGSYMDFPDCPGKAYLDLAGTGYNRAAWTGDTQTKPFTAFMQDFVGRIAGEMNYTPVVEILASPFVFTQAVEVDGKPHVFIANYRGLKGKEKARQIPEAGMKVSVPAEPGAKAYFLPFLGEKQEVNGENRDGRMFCTLPDIDKGAVFWVE
jgi:hypothetical protein